MSSPRERFPLWPLILALALLLAALGTLLWLREHLVQLERTVLDSAVRRFEMSNVLGRPESRSLVFADLEVDARTSENELIRRIHVTKLTHEGEELTVRPFYIDLTDPRWREQKQWTRLQIGERQPVGYLYADIDNTTIRAVNGAITLFGFLLATGLAVLLLRQRGKEVQLSRVTDELENRKVQVIHLERLALAGQLSANIFHDIKKPVLNIKHEVSDALDGMGPPAEEVLRAVRTQTDLFLQMLRDLGMESFVNATEQRREWCDLVEVVDRSLRLVRYEQSGIQTHVEFEPGKQFLIQGVPHRLVQLFSNLALNAFQAMGEQGTLRIKCWRSGERIVMTFEDSGPGIPPERREEVFSPFVTSRSESGGSGLGLYISRSIVTDLQGTLRLTDPIELGGARFEIQFLVAGEG